MTPGGDCPLRGPTKSLTAAQHILDVAAARCDALAATMAAVAQDTPRQPSPSLTAALRCSAALLSDDLDEVRAAEAIARTWCAAAEAAVIAADNGREADYAAYERAEAEFCRADHAVALLGRRLEELEQEAEWDEVREQRRAYWRRAI